MSNNLKHNHPVDWYLTGISTSCRACLYLLVITSFSLMSHHSSAYMAQADNFLNQYFVKFAWGWTFSAGTA